MISTLIKALKNKIFWYMATRYLTFALQFLSSIYIAKKLGTYYWGIWSFILLLINIGTVMNWGIGNSIHILLIQHKADLNISARYCYNGFILSCLIMIPIVLFTLYERLIGIPFFAKYHVGNAIYAVLLIVCMGYLNTFFINVYRVKNRLFAVAVSQSAFPAACFVLMFFANGKNLLTVLIAGYVFAVFSACIILLCNKYIDWHEQIDFKIMSHIFMKGFYLFCYNACFLMITLSTKSIISIFYPVESFGYFSFACSLANATMLLVDSFTFVAFPQMINMLQEGNAAVDRIQLLRRCYLLSISGIVYLAIPGCGILLRFLPQYQDSLSCFIMIILALGLYPLCYGYNTYLMANNKEKIMAGLVGIALLVNIFLTYLMAGVLHLRMEFCVIGIMVAYFFFAMGINVYARRCLNQDNRLKSILRTIPLYCLCPFCLAFLLFFFNKLTLFYIMTPFVIFLLFSAKEMFFLKKIALKLLNNPNILNVK